MRVRVVVVASDISVFLPSGRRARRVREVGGVGRPNTSAKLATTNQLLRRIAVEMTERFDLLIQGVTGNRIRGLS